jgi:hypothetical protein
MLLTMASSSGSDVAVHATASEMPEVLLVAVAGICRNLFGIGAQHRANIGQQAWQSAGVRRTRLQALGDDDLMGAIDRDLSVVAGNHRLGTQRLNAAIGIREIALRPIGRKTGLNADETAAKLHSFIRCWSAARPWATNLRQIEVEFRQVSCCCIAQSTRVSRLTTVRRHERALGLGPGAVVDGEPDVVFASRERELGVTDSPAENLGQAALLDQVSERHRPALVGPVGTRQLLEPLAGRASPQQLASLGQKAIERRAVAPEFRDRAAVVGNARAAKSAHADFLRSREGGALARLPCPEIATTLKRAT